ncbi:PirG [Mycobacterium sp. Aquia_216]|uniref:PirG n=1 Tax=Mycobacterium sp. Aquia_216 TaxID=2991729 RepID=UPI00227C3064|nr:PirG [Mycobacterium sp. Aquia_216]WAJ45109.1 PirG [Mycobacterium sp. Aquia_216]
MPNRRRRKLSTAMSAVAALAVASPCAYFLVYESTASSKPVEHHEFKQAAVMTDLPGELVGALTQGLSSFGLNLPPIPALGGAGTGASGLTSPGLGTPGLGTTGLTSPGLASPGLGAPGLGTPGLTNPGLTSPGLTAPSALTPGAPTTPGLATTPGAGINPALTSPAAGLTPGGLGAPGEVPISAPLDAGADGTYPILGDPSTLGGGSPTGGSGGGGLVNDVMQAANQLGAGQAIDLLKGLVMPAIAQAQGGALPGAAGALPGAAGALPGAAHALPGALGALPGAAGALPGAAAALPPALPPV